MVQFRKRKSDGQAFPLSSKKPRLPRSGSNKLEGMNIGKGIKIPKGEEPEPILETELTDIFGDVEIEGSKDHEIDDEKLDKVVKESIKEILEREKKLDSNDSISITQVSSRQEEQNDGDTGFYQYDYTIFRGKERTSFSGTAYGSISAGDVIDMTLELYDEREM